MYFSPEELKQEIRPPSEKALEALEKGRRDELAFWIGRMSVGHQLLCTSGVYWITRLMTKIRKDHGESVLLESLEEIFQPLLAFAARDFREEREKRAASFFLTLWRTYLGGMSNLEEGDRDIRMNLAPCGLGGRVLLEGWYESDPGNFSCSDDGTPMFCKGCQVLQQVFNTLADRNVLEILPERSKMGVCRFKFLKRVHTGKKIFSDEELYRARTPDCDLALARLREGRLEGIKELLTDQHRDWRPLHDFLGLWITVLESAMYRRHGAGYVADLIDRTYVPMFDSAYRLFGIMDDKNAFRSMVETWHYHQATFQVEEEEDRFVFTLDPCGSGGRLFRGDMGEWAPKYGEDMSLMEEPHVCNFLRSGFPIYCTHCALSNLDQFNGKPRIFVVDGHAMKDPQSPCVQYLYKKHGMDNIPSSLLEQVKCEALQPVPKEYIP